MNKATLTQRLWAAADWIERVDESPKFRRAVYGIIIASAIFFGGVIIGILVR